MSRPRKGAEEPWIPDQTDFYNGGNLGHGSLAHATASANRESIREWGLDWKRMGIASGIAGSLRFELDAVFLDHIHGVHFFTGMSRLPCDVWEVDVRGLWIEEYEGWLIHKQPISPDRLRLSKTYLPPQNPLNYSTFAVSAA
jgi:hypothetical protein